MFVCLLARWQKTTKAISTKLGGRMQCGSGEKNLMLVQVQESFSTFFNIVRQEMFQHYYNNNNNNNWFKKSGIFRGLISESMISGAAWFEFNGTVGWCAERWTPLTSILVDIVSTERLSPDLFMAFPLNHPNAHWAETDPSLVKQHSWAGCVRVFVPVLTKRNQFSSVTLLAIICSGVGCLSTRRADMAPRQLFKSTLMGEDLI